jgi:alkylated DNA nucleotide flippase Atl1
MSLGKWSGSTSGKWLEPGKATTSQPPFPYPAFSRYGKWWEAVAAAPAAGSDGGSTSREVIREVVAEGAPEATGSVIHRPASERWPWWRVVVRGERGQLHGPDGRYRGSMTLTKAQALAQELNGLDPRVDHAAYQAWLRSKEVAK